MSPPPQKKKIDDLVGSLLTWMDKWRFIVIIKLVLLNNQQLYCITKSTKNGTIFSHISLGSLLSFSVWYTMDIKPTIELPQKNDRLVGSLLAWMEKWRFIVIIKLVLLVLISSLLISQQPQVARNRQYFFSTTQLWFSCLLWGRYDMQFDVKFNYFQLLQRLSDAHHGADPIEWMNRRQTPPPPNVRGPASFPGGNGQETKKKTHLQEKKRFEKKKKECITR